jgi:hypothetical protein
MYGSKEAASCDCQLAVAKAADVHPAGAFSTMKSIENNAFRVSEFAHFSFDAPMWDIACGIVGHFWGKVGHIWGTRSAKKPIILPETRFSSERKKTWDIWDILIKC